jgi:pyruvate dehydrogenase E1 component beta subunit
VKGLLAASIRDNDPVIFFEQKELYPLTGDVPDGEYLVPLGQANVVRSGGDGTIVALAGGVHLALEAAEQLAANDDLDCEVVDLRCLVPLDVRAVIQSVSKTGRLITVEETPRPCGWGAELCSIVVEEAFDDLDAPVVRVTTEPVPLPAAPNLEDLARPSVERILSTVRRLVGRQG